jgi:predicted nucleic acid-binding protein
MTLLAADAQTFELAADAMERLAMHQPEAHRLPLADLLTAALAHQHGCGVVHFDGDYEAISEHGGLNFKSRQITVTGEGGGEHPVAGRQRALKADLAQLLHHMPVEQAEKFLERVVEEARAAAAETRP